LRPPRTAGRWLALAVGLAAVLLASRQALAHAELLRAEPAPGATAPAGLSEVRLIFDQAISPASSLSLFTGEFSPGPTLAASVDGAVLVGRSASPLPAGAYTLQWTAISLDGHTAEGSYQIAVAAATTARWPGWVRAGAWVTAGLALIVAIVAINLILRRRGRPA